MDGKNIITNEKTIVLSALNKYGFFDIDNREFVITRPDTPLPWVNYLTNGNFNSLISHAAGGFLFYKSPKDSRITRFRYNSLPVDRPGHYVYLRDKSDGCFWSPTWQPTPEINLDFYECRHGLNYTKIRSIFRNIECEIFYFVPLNDDIEIWKINLFNKGEKEVELDVFGFVELCLGHALVDLINQPNDQHFNNVYFNRDKQILFASKRYWVTFNKATVAQGNKAWDRWVYMASSLPIKGFDGKKTNFIGKWRSESNPIAVYKGKCTDSETDYGDAVFAIQMNVKIKPMQSLEFPIMLGVVPKEDGYEEAALNIVNKYRNLKNVKSEINKLKIFWDDYLSGMKIDVPDPLMNLMINCWNQYQTYITFKFSRDASYHHGGLLFGRGFRDSCQDIFGPLLTKPEWTKIRIREMSTKQFQKGNVYHCYYPLSGGGEVTGHSDTALWLIYAVTYYLKETADFAFLDEITPFDDEGSATILEHCFKALDYTFTRLSPRNLALFGPGDWNDTLDYLGRGGKGESVMVTEQIAYALKEIIELLQHLNHPKLSYYQEWYEKIKDALNNICWDGEWYWRGTNDQGEIIGSKKNEEGKIFLNVQSWAVISGIADEERLKKAMDSAYKYLNTPKGPKILGPAFRTINPNIGLATRCVAGKKENAAVFNHPVSWAIVAEYILGRSEKAFAYYKAALPMNEVVGIDRYEVEPYVYAEYVTSDEHPTFGQASHSWLTGSSVWMLRGATDYCLGLKPCYEGLKIDPCVPADWESFKAERKFRNTLYRISYKNPNHVKKGVKSITVDGNKIDSQILPVFNDGKEHIVEVLMG